MTVFFCLLWLVNCGSFLEGISCQLNSDCQEGFFCSKEETAKNGFCLPRKNEVIIGSEKTIVEKREPENFPEEVKLDNWEKIQEEPVKEPAADKAEIITEPANEEIISEDAGGQIEAKPEIVTEVEPEIVIEEPQTEVATEKEAEVDPCPKIGLPCQTGKPGVCQNGIYRCHAQKEFCEQNLQPGAEICDDLDNNCDGQIDEGLPNCCQAGQSRTCGAVAPKGECKKGTQFCDQNRKWSACVGEVGPIAEICDGKDNNCDGRVDEDLSDCCLPGSTASCGTVAPKGECKEGTKTCDQNRKWGFCLGEIKPTTEICDGKDNNCDGQVDENLTQDCYTGPSGTFNVGLCKGGKKTCRNGIWQACVNEVKPQTEICDGLDNNCNGQIDEGFDLLNDVNNCGKCNRKCTSGPNSQTTCSSGTCGYKCQKGWLNIVKGVTSTNPVDGCPCEQGVGVEICDGKDNDCDGVIDNNCAKTELVYGPNQATCANNLLPDLSGNNRNGELREGAFCTNGILDLTQRGYIFVNNASGLSPTSSQITLMFWFKIPTPPIQYMEMFFWRFPYAPSCYSIFIGSNAGVRCVCEDTGQSNVDSKSFAPFNQWTHIAYSIDGPLKNLYFNGKQEASRSDNNPACSTFQSYITDFNWHPNTVATGRHSGYFKYIIYSGRYYSEQQVNLVYQIQKDSF